MPLEESTFTSRDGLVLFKRSWLTEAQARAAVVLVHGGGEHSGRYLHVANFFNQHGINVHTFDLRGHGRSQGKRLFIRSFEEYLDDLALLFNNVQHRELHRPLFMLGHSLGGAIVTLFVLNRTPYLDGVVLSGPFLHVGEGFSPLKVAMAKMIGKIMPLLPVSTLDSDLVSSDPEVVENYKTDPLNHHKGIPAGTGVATLKALFEIQQKMASMTLPFLIVHGAKDGLADVEGSRTFYDTAASSEKALKMYEGFYHEVLNEPGKEQVLADIMAWIEQRMAAKSKSPQV